MQTDELYDNEFKELIKRFENSVSEDVAYFFDTEDLLDLIDYYFNEEKPEMARKALDIGLTFSPENTEFKIREAQYLASEDDPEKAIDLLEKLEAIEPNNPEIFFTKGNIYSYQNKSEQAIREYNRVIPDVKNLETTNDLEDVYMSIAFEYENLGNYDKAIEYMKKVVELHPLHDYVPADLAQFFEYSNRIDEGVAYMKEMLEKEPFSKGLWLGLGLIYRAKGLNEEALESFDYVLAIDEDDWNGWFHKATTYLILERYNDALACYQRILEVTPNEVSTLFNIAECYERMDDYKTAQTYFLKVLEIEPDLPQAIICLAMNYFNQKKKNKAFSVLKDALKKNPEAAELHVALGELYGENNEFERGLAHIFHAVDLTNDQPEFVAAVCYAMIEAGFKNEALNYIESKIVQNENYAWFILIRGVVNMKINRKDAALNDLLVAFLTDPSNVSRFKEFHPEMLENPEISKILRKLNNGKKIN